jgi:hypothetical protein
MLEILQSKLEELKYLKDNASNWEYYLGQYNLCLELLNTLQEQEFEFIEMADEILNNKYIQTDEELPF